jgi:hypothetical protein
MVLGKIQTKLSLKMRELQTSNGKLSSMVGSDLHPNFLHTQKIVQKNKIYLASAAMEG